MRKIKACYFAKKAGYEILLRAYFCNIFAILVENGKFEQNIRDEKPQNPAEAAIFEYIHQNLRESITLDTLSEISHFSNSYVIRLFKKSTGQTPTEYVNRCRISLAKKLLESKSVTETALDCGFNNISYFIRTFKRYTGVRNDLTAGDDCAADVLDFYAGIGQKFVYSLTELTEIAGAAAGTDPGAADSAVVNRTGALIQCLTDFSVFVDECCFEGR